MLIIYIRPVLYSAQIPADKTQIYIDIYRVSKIYIDIYRVSQIYIETGCPRNT